MADIFISYANEDRDAAARLARALESAGWTVWWDRRIPAGRTWRSVLQDALKEMRCMVALWSRDSVESPWVAEEAEEARKLGKTLVPILIQRVEPPIGFRAIQAADLIDWNGSPDDPAIKMLMADLESLLGKPSTKVSGMDIFIETPEIERRRRVFPASKRWLLAACAGIASVSLLVGWQIWTSVEQENGAPVLPAQTGYVKLPAPQLTGLAVSGERKEIKPSETVKLSVTANYSDGTQDYVKEGIEWASSNRSVASVSEQGEVKALRAGAASITAKTRGAVSPAWTVTVKAPDKAPESPVKAVEAPKLVALNISSSRSELFTNEKIFVRAKGRYSDNSEKLLSDAVDWETSDRTIASINDDGELKTLRPGRVDIQARAGHLQSKPLSIVIKETQPSPPPETKPTRPSGPPPVTPPVVSEQSKAQILAYTTRAKAFREQGNYSAALAELEKAKALDASNEEVRSEIEQTKRACNAEKILGNKLPC
jgi:hypothetical protein